MQGIEQVFSDDLIFKMWELHAALKGTIGYIAHMNLHIFTETKRKIDAESYITRLILLEECNLLFIRTTTS